MLERHHEVGVSWQCCPTMVAAPGMQQFSIRGLWAGQYRVQREGLLSVQEGAPLNNGGPESGGRDEELPMLHHELHQP